MNQTAPESPREPRRSAAPWLISASIIAAMIGLLRLEGRRWFCACGQIRVWIGDVWTSHCSQHLLDPYSLTHISHGLILWGVLALVARRRSPAWRLSIAVAVAAAWEVLENSPMIINRYRAATMSLDYLGDSVVNSVGDVLSCAAGFAIARRLGWKWSLALFAATEVALLILIRDNLTLNVIMLIRPVDAIRAWQTAGHPG